jgi:hypothetical protein
MKKAKSFSFDKEDTERGYGSNYGTIILLA